MMNKDNNDLSLRIKAMTEKWREKEMCEHHLLKQKEVEMDFFKAKLGRVADRKEEEVSQLLMTLL